MCGTFWCYRKQTRRIVCYLSTYLLKYSRPVNLFLQVFLCKIFPLIFNKKGNVMVPDFILLLNSHRIYWWVCFVINSVSLYLHNINKKPKTFYGINDDLRTDNYGNYWSAFYVDEKVVGIKTRSWRWKNERNFRLHLRRSIGFFESGI